MVEIIISHKVFIKKRIFTFLLSQNCQSCFLYFEDVQNLLNISVEFVKYPINKAKCIYHTVYGKQLSHNLLNII